MENLAITELKSELGKLASKVGSLEALVNKNNFSSTQTFNKDCIFSSRLKVPHYTSAPSVAEIGDLIEVSGKLYICTTASTGGAGAVFTLVGSQT